MGSVTYHTLVPESLHLFCSAMAALSSQIEHDLYRDLQAGKKVNDLKRDYQKLYEINARQFNAIYINLKGKISSRSECYKNKIKDLTAQITELEKTIKKLEKRRKQTPPACSIEAGSLPPRRVLRQKIHHKKIRLHKLRAELTRLHSRKPTIIFGSKKLWLAQFNLEANGYTSHSDWKRDWQQHRASQFSFVGSGDETAGCQVCQLCDDGTLLIKVPQKLSSQFGEYNAAKRGIYVAVSDIKFPYGQADIEYALASGQCISYRFVKKDSRWYLHASTERPEVPYQSRYSNGMLGVDLNPGVIGWAYCDCEGNLKANGQIQLNIQDRSTEQTEATLGDAVRELVNIASRYGCPITVEELDFSKKKINMKQSGVRYSRMLSNFAYAKFDQMLVSRGERFGIQVIHVNPAYSSVIGLTKYMSQYGLKSDTAAALVLARRSLRLSERIPASVGQGLPEEKPRHSWSYWNFVKKKLGDALKRRHSFFTRASNRGAVVNLPGESRDRLGGKSQDASVPGCDSSARIADNTARSACLDKLNYVEVCLDI